MVVLRPLLAYRPTLKTVFTNLAEGAPLVRLVLLLFLANFRAAAIVAAVIPLSLLATFLGLTWSAFPPICSRWVPWISASSWTGR